MKQFLSHCSAAVHYRIPNFDDIINAETLDKYKNNELIDITVTNPKRRYYKKNHKTHLCSLNLPQGATIRLLSGTFIASPELVFLQLATNLSIQKLIYLGLQMCSHSVKKQEEAITTKEKLSRFISKMNGHRGYKKAMYAMKYIENGSSSKMESIVFMILTLPNSLGGYGLKGAQLNYEIKLKNKGIKELGQKKCYIDLYYDSANLAVEYDSFENHSTATQQGKDLRRETILEHQGLSIIRCSTIQIYNRTACESFVKNVAKRLGKRIQIRTTKFNPSHNEIRALLGNKYNKK